MAFPPIMKQIERRFLAAYRSSEIKNGEKMNHFKVWFDGFYHGVKFAHEVSQGKNVFQKKEEEKKK